MDPFIETLIVGAGPAGLAVAGRLSQLGMPFEILEKEQAAAPAWRQHYDRLHLHTVKQFSQLPHLPFPKDYPVYVPRKQVVEYFDQYCQHFHIQPVLGQEVVSIQKDGESWRTQTREGLSLSSTNVVVCTGFNRKPYSPEWPGKERFQGEIMHSRFYKNGKPYAGKKVLVVGMGNTGAELAVDLHEHGAQPWISVRGPVNIVRRDVFGRPTQLTAMQLRKLPDWLGDRIGTLLSRLTVGDLSRYGIQRRKLAPAAQLRLYGKTPVIDVGTIDLIKAGKIKVLPGISRFEKQEVVFEDGQQLHFDAVILATGYKAAVEDFLDDTQGLFNEHGVPRALWLEDKPGLYFLGFDAYSTGILQHVCEDSEKIVKKMCELAN